MVNEGAPMVDDAGDEDAGDEDEESSDEEEEIVTDMARKLECDSAWKNHARVQVTLPAGMQPNVVHINTFCSNENNKLWGEIGYTEVAALPHTATNRFKITDDLVKAYATIAARANDLRVSKPVEDGGSKVMLLLLVTETLASQGASILAPPHGSDGVRVLALNKNVPPRLAGAGVHEVGACVSDVRPWRGRPGRPEPGGPEAAPVNIPRMREHLPSSDDGGGVADKLVQAWEDGYSVGSKSFSPLRMWTNAARKLAWEDVHLPMETPGDCQEMRNWANTRLGNLAAMYWAVKNIKKEDRPTSVHGLKAAGLALLKSVSGKLQIWP